MKVESSRFISDVKPLLKQLLDKLLAEYSYASILANDAVGKKYRASKTSVTILEDPMYSERGFVAKVYDGKGYGEYSFSEISEATIDTIFNEIKLSLMPLAGKLPAGINESTYAELSDEKIVLNESTDFETDPFALGDEKIITLLKDIVEEGLKTDSRIIDTIGICQFQKYHKLFLSKNKDMEQNVMWTTGAVLAMAKEPDGDEVKDAYKPVSVLGGAEVLGKLKNHLANTCNTAIELLSAEPIVPGEYDCICEPDVTGMIVHEAFGHGVEMDMFVKKRALAEKYVGEYVASPLINMRDGAKTIDEAATFFFDDEGVLAHDTLIIDKGILKTGICDAQSAMHLGKEPTGNGRRESTRRKAYTRMTNTIFEAGDSKVEDMIASIENGFLLQNAMSGMEDPKNWGIQLMVTIAREIRDGKLTGKIFSPIVLTGYVPDLLKSISMVSDKVEACGSGMCGKGYKEWVKVSDGGPYIKAKIRLG